MKEGVDEIAEDFFVGSGGMEGSLFDGYGRADEDLADDMGIGCGMGLVVGEGYAVGRGGIVEVVLVEFTALGFGDKMDNELVSVDFLGLEESSGKGADGGVIDG